MGEGDGGRSLSRCARSVMTKYGDEHAVTLQAPHLLVENRHACFSNAPFFCLSVRVNLAAICKSIRAPWTLEMAQIV